MSNEAPVRTISTQVAIVGGGPVGIALAIALGQHGVRCCVIERHSAPQQVPKGQNLTQRTMEHFRSWGCATELRAARTMRADRPITGWTSYGSILGEHRYPWMPREEVGAFYAEANERLPQYRTESVLRTRLAELDSVTVLTGFTAEEVGQSSELAWVAATTRDGERIRIEAQFLVGCDGARSVVRTQTGIGQERSDVERLMVLAVFRSTEFDELVEPLDISFANVLNPTMDGYWQFFGRVDDRETWFFHCPVAPGTDTENIDLSEILHSAAGASFNFEIEHLGFWELRFELADSYSDGRIFIAGDAAHSHPPYGGYGINTGFEDAANLAWKLIAEIEGWAGPDLLASYSAERRPVFASLRDRFIRRSIEVDRAFLQNYSPAQDPDAFTEAWAQRSFGTAAEVDSYEPNYEGSPLLTSSIPGAAPGAVGAHLARARAGHHLAPGELADGGAVFDGTTIGFTLLTLQQAGAQELVDQAAEWGLPLRIATMTADTSLAYEAEVVLLRPDHFVAWAGDRVPGAEVLGYAVGRPATSIPPSNMTQTRSVLDPA